MNDKSEARFTIDELAAKTGVPSRTIRFYQSKCGLPPPVRQGRKAYYAQAHIDRLELIARLQDRGLQIRAIRNLLEQLDSGQTSMEEWLGFEAELRTPWSHDVPVLLSEDEVQERLLGRPPGLLAALVKAGLVERESNQYLVRSPALLTMALDLERHGIDVETAHEATQILASHLSKAAKELSVYFQEHVQRRFPDGSSDLLGALKPVALEAASVVFAREVQQALEQMLREGRIQPLGARAPKADPIDSPPSASGAKPAPRRRPTSRE